MQPSLLSGLLHLGPGPTGLHFPSLTTQLTVRFFSVTVASLSRSLRARRHEWLPGRSSPQVLSKAVKENSEEMWTTLRRFAKLFPGSGGKEGVARS